MVEVPASAAIFLVDSAWSPCSARSLAAMSTSAVRVSGSSFRGLTLTVLHNTVIFDLTMLCQGGGHHEHRGSRVGDHAGAYHRAGIRLRLPEAGRAAAGRRCAAGGAGGPVHAGQSAPGRC